MGLTAKTPVLAFIGTLVKVLLVPWVIFMAGMGLAAPAIGPGAWVVGLWLLVSFANCLGLCSWASNRLQDQFREAASTQA